MWCWSGKSIPKATRSNIFLKQRSVEARLKYEESNPKKDPEKTKVQEKGSTYLNSSPPLHDDTKDIRGYYIGFFRNFYPPTGSSFFGSGGTAGQKQLQKPKKEKWFALSAY
jgi:hypothetical protein